MIVTPATNPQAPIGLLAGSGRFPILFAQKARQLGRPVVCVGINDEAPAELVSLVDRFYWTGVAKLGRMIRCFKREGVKDLRQAGLLKVRQGLTSLQEVEAVTNE